VDYIEGKEAAIHVAAVDGSGARAIWRGAGASINQLVWTDEPDGFLVGLDLLDEWEQSVACLGRDGQLHRVEGGWYGFEWSYHRGTRRLIHNNRERDAFDTRSWQSCGVD
jgi:hypothetical protein